MVLEDRNFQVDFLKSKTSNSLDIFYWVLFVFLSSKGWTQCKNSLFLGEKVHCEYFCVWNTGRDANCMCIPMFDFLALVQRFVSEIEKMIPLLTCFIKSSRLDAYVKRTIIFFFCWHASWLSWPTLLIFKRFCGNWSRTEMERKLLSTSNTAWQKLVNENKRSSPKKA